MTCQVLVDDDVFDKLRFVNEPRKFGGTELLKVFTALRTISPSVPTRTAVCKLRVNEIDRRCARAPNS
jgi:hypothetical protein